MIRFPNNEPPDLTQEDTRAPGCETTGQDIAYVRFGAPVAVVLCDGQRVEELVCAESRAFAAWLARLGNVADCSTTFEYSQGSGAQIGSCCFIEPGREYRVLSLRVLSAEVGFIREQGSPAFGDSDRARLWQFGIVMASALRVEHELSRQLAHEAAALRGVGAGPGSLFVVDLERSEIVWTDSDEETPSLLFEAQLSSAARQLLSPRAQGAPPQSSPKIDGALLVHAAHIVIDPASHWCRYAACRVQAVGRASQPLGLLSPREFRIAQLLAAGYSAVNVASIAGITEHTVRTHIRRIYRKLGIASRSELARSVGTSSCGETQTEPREPRRESGFVPVATAEPQKKKLLR